MRNLIYFLGTDGSGKTTLSKELISDMKKLNVKASYLYARHIPILLAPIKLISRILIFKGNDQFKNYDQYRKLKSNFSNNHPILAAVYAALWIMDYILFVWPKVVITYLFSHNIVIDRYVGDVVVNIAIATGLSDNGMYFLLKLLHKLFPLPNYSFFIEIDEETAFNRKNDIPSIFYLKERKEKYYRLRDYYHFDYLDGRKSTQNLADYVFSKLNAAVENDRKGC